MRPVAVNILGVQVHPVDVPLLHEQIGDLIEGSAHALILNVNVHCLNLAYERAWLRGFLNSAELVFCDGAGVILGARLLGYRLPQRITYADWLWQLADYVQAHDYSLFFLGAAPGIAEQAAQRLRQHYPRLRIVGVHHGYFDKTPTGAENRVVVDLINRANPHILLVAFGMPLQERWLAENWQVLDARIALTGGAVFDYISGNLRRGPEWMTNHGLEWLARLLIEPRRLWRRYLLGNPLFLWRICRQRFRPAP